MPIPIENCVFSTIARALKTVFNRYGIPKLLHFDQATYFTCSQMKEFGETQNIKIEYADANVHKNVLVERAIKSLEETIGRCIDSNQVWSDVLENAAFFITFPSIQRLEKPLLKYLWDLNATYHLSFARMLNLQ